MTKSMDEDAKAGLVHQAPEGGWWVVVGREGRAGSQGGRSGISKSPEAVSLTYVGIVGSQETKLLGIAAYEREQG